MKRDEFYFHIREEKGESGQIENKRTKKKGFLLENGDLCGIFIHRNPILIKGECMIKIGIIGCGVIAPTHIQSYQRLPEVEVVALCDLIPEKAEALAEKFSIPGIFTDFRKLLQEPSIDAVSICTDHESHTAIAIAALQAGKHVLCEKSLASNKENLAMMVEEAAKHPDLVASGVFQHRFDPSYLYLKELLEEKTFGTILTADLSVMCLRTKEYYEADSWRGTWAKEGGALLINQAIHFIDMISWVMGGVKSLSGAWSNLAHQGIIECEDTASVSLLYRNGALGTITASSASPLNWEPVMTFNGTKGSLSLINGKLDKVRLPGNEEKAEEIRKRFQLLSEEPPISKSYYGSGHPQMLNNFAEAVKAKDPGLLQVPFASAAHAPHIVLSIYESHNKNGERVEILY